MKLKDKVAVVTGAAAGIGKGIGTRYAWEGAKVVLADFDEQRGNKTLLELLESGANAIFQQTDMASAMEVERLIHRTVEHYGRIDILFNNAGIEGDNVPIDEYEEQTFNRVMAVNCRGVFLAMKYAIAVMRKHGTGSIVNNSSIRGIVGRSNLCGYVASKHAVAGLTKAAALDCAKTGIRVNAICPGPVDTEMMLQTAIKYDPNDTSRFFDLIKQWIPEGRLGTVEEVANLVTFLSSDESTYMNGAIIAIDGGMTAC